MRTHSLEGRKREEQVGELENMACQKRGLTDWRRGRGRSGLVSSETWHVTNEGIRNAGGGGRGSGWVVAESVKEIMGLTEGRGGDEEVGCSGWLSWLN